MFWNIQKPAGKNEMKLAIIILCLYMSNFAHSEPFNLVCDTPLQRNTYQFVPDGKEVKKIGYYSYETGEFTRSPEEIIYHTAGWDTDHEAVVWVIYDFTNPVTEDVLFTRLRHGTMVNMVFDLHYMYLTYAVLTRDRGRVTHYNSSRIRCYSE